MGKKDKKIDQFVIKLMEQDNWIKKAKDILNQRVEELEKTSQDYKDFSDATNEYIAKEQELQDVISTLKAENNALQEKLNNVHPAPFPIVHEYGKAYYKILKKYGLEDFGVDNYIYTIEEQVAHLTNQVEHLENQNSSERQLDIEDKAFSYAILLNVFGLNDTSGKTLIDYIADLSTENIVLNAQLDLVPYQLEKQRELCAKTYEYWTRMFRLPIKCDDIPNHITQHIKTTRIPTPDDLGNPADEAPHEEGMTYPEGQD